ncbi:hypothetical protein BHM03_00048271 [Ensete ventricosum]|nr:hypothetical protein BHM03_00048271 [Ensete ventricosum]
MADRHPYLQDQDHNDDCNHEEIDNEVLFGIGIEFLIINWMKLGRLMMIRPFAFEKLLAEALAKDALSPIEMIIYPLIDFEKRRRVSVSYKTECAAYRRAAGMAAASFSAVAVPIKSGLSAVTILRRLLACARPLHFLPQSQSPRRGLVLLYLSPPNANSTLS